MNDHLSDKQIDSLALNLAPERQASEWEGHLRACPACRQQLERRRAILTSLASLPAPDPPAGLWRERTARATRLTDGRIPKLTGFRPRYIQPPVRAWAGRILVLATVFVAGYFLGSRGPASESTASPGETKRDRFESVGGDVARPPRADPGDGGRMEFTSLTLTQQARNKNQAEPYLWSASQEFLVRMNDHSADATLGDRFL